MNERLVRWFDAGYAKEALLGKEQYFIPETTYRDRHDRILVVDQLLLWASGNERSASAIEALVATLEAMVVDLEILAAYDLVWSYLLVRRDHELGLPLDATVLLPTLDEVDRSVGSIPDEVAELRRRVRAELAELR